MHCFFIFDFNFWNLNESKILYIFDQILIYCYARLNLSEYAIILYIKLQSIIIIFKKLNNQTVPIKDFEQINIHFTPTITYHTHIGSICIFIYKKTPLSKLSHFIRSNTFRSPFSKISTRILNRGAFSKPADEPKEKKRELFRTGE